jgi:putative DNA primase/helicase
MCFGEGSNGKTVLLELMLWLLGSYAIAVDPSTWLEQKDPSKPRPDIARMRGARFTKSSESRDGLRLDMGVVKQVTGGDRLTARHLYQKETSFEAKCKPWFATNHKPEIPHTDHGTWRRIVLIPFQVKITEDKADGELAEKLRDEGPGVLAWLVRGALDWLQLRLAIPSDIARYAQAYKADQDILGGFFDDCCDLTRDFLGQLRVANAGDLYGTYRRWAEKMGERMLSSQKFGRMLAERGFHNEKTTGGRRFWRGLGLVSPPPEAATGVAQVADIGLFPESTHVSST